eukprot:COSAG01_NODE_635_length_14662_cov_12.488773_5_plen_133_part_00
MPSSLQSSVNEITFTWPFACVCRYKQLSAAYENEKTFLTRECRNVATYDVGTAELDRIHDVQVAEQQASMQRTWATDVSHMHVLLTRKSCEENCDNAIHARRTYQIHKCLMRCAGRLRQCLKVVQVARSSKI